MKAGVYFLILSRYEKVSLHRLRVYYDPALGDPENGIAPGTAFDDLPDGWICPVCGEGKWAFEPLEEQ